MNQVTVYGRLTADPSDRTTTSGKSYSAASIACNTGYGDRPETLFFNFHAYRQPGVYCTQYLKKGDAVLAFGELKPSIKNQNIPYFYVSKIQKVVRRANSEDITVEPETIVENGPQEKIVFIPKPTEQKSLFKTDNDNCPF